MNHTRTVAWITIVLTLAVALPAVAQQDHPQLKIASYNIENAFDVFDDPYTRDEGTRVKPRREVQTVAKALRAINADVVGMMEVENEGVIQAMVDDYLPDMGYDYIAVPLTNSDRGIKLALISRLPIISVTSYRWQTLDHPDSDRTWRFARDLMHAKIQAPGGQIVHVFVVHLKSKRTTEGDPKSTLWRTAEAIRVRQIIDELLANDPDALAVLIGDFNSQLGDPATSTLLAPGPNGGPLLSDSHRLIPMDQRITFPSERYPNTVIDFILTSPAMSARLVPDSPAIINDPKLTKGSDHYPVVATFDMAP